MTWRAVTAMALIAFGGHIFVQAQVPFPGSGGGIRPVLPPDLDAPERPDERAVFRSGVTLVAIDALVTGADGNPVTGLTADDFEILEAGRPRAVSTFEAVDIPIDPPADIPADAPEPDVTSNTAPRGRTYLIAFDEVSPSRILRARNFARRFITEHMGPNDVAAVALTGRGLADSGQDFTSRRSLLFKAIDKFSGGFGSSTPNVSETPDANGTQGPAQDDAFSSDPRQLASSLRKLTEFLATLPGRKTLLYVGEGLGDRNGIGGLDFDALAAYRGISLTPADQDAHAALAAATRGNVTIYPVDPRGMTTDLTPAAGPNGTPALYSAILENRAYLSALGRVTGGFAITNTNDIGPAFDRIVRENSTYYTLGFNSEYPRRDGRFVRVEVRVKRPGLQVRARNGFVAPLGEERRPDRVEGEARLRAVADALANAASTRGLGMRVFAAPYRASRDRALIALAVEIDASALGFATSNGASTAAVEISYLATDAKGKVRPGRRHTATLTLPPEAMNAARKQDVRVLSQFELPPGRYQLRVAAGSGSTAGSVVHDLDVPDFGKGPLTMSAIAVTWAAAAGVTTLRPHDPFAERLPSAPTASRTFARGDEVVLFTEIYDNRDIKAAGTGPIELTASLQNERGIVLRLAEPESRAATAARRSSGGHGFVTRLPLDVEPGSYVLAVEARSGASGPAVSRMVPIRVQQ